ncbi:MAG: 4Fe-4S dicluster domain-containing protein [Candidatus Bathyarchaeia archaeon]
MVRYAYVVDLDKCVGCRACMVACKVENGTVQGAFWMYVFRFEEGEYPNVRYTFMPRPCQHCDNPPCVKVCPVGSRYKREDGLVLEDYDRCIGCRYCEVACPYGVNYFNWHKPEDRQYYDWKNSDLEAEVGEAIPPYKNPDHDKRHGPEQVFNSGGPKRAGIVHKCTWCVHRIEKGLEPACVAGCPVSALVFGDLDNPNSRVSRILASKRSWRLQEELGTQPRVFYVGKQPITHESKIISLEFIKRENSSAKVEVTA